MSKLIAIAKRHWAPLVGLNAVIFLFAAFQTTLVEDTWSAEAKLIIPNATSDLNVNLGGLGDVQGGEGLVFSQQLDSRQILLSIMLSDDTLRPVWQIDPNRDTFDKLSAFKDMLTAKSSDASTVLSIVAEAETAEIAQDRLENWIHSFQQRLNELRESDVAQRNTFFEKELIKAQNDLDDAQNQLVEFQESTNLVDSESQIRELVEIASGLSRMQGETTAQFTASQARLTALTQRLGQTPEQAIIALELGENQGYQSLRQKLAEVNVALAESRAMFTEQHPEMQYLLESRAQLISEQAQYLEQATQSTIDVNTDAGENFSALIQDLILAESETQGLQEQSTQLQQQINAVNEQLGQIPAVQARLIELQRQYSNAEGVYNGLVAQTQAIKIGAFSSYPNVQILDQPSINPSPLGPGKRPIALGAILASAFGSAAIIFFLEGRNPLLSANDAHSFGLPVLGNIAQIKSPKIIEPAELGRQLGCQQLAVAISKMSLKNQRLLITSPLAKEGKTTLVRGIGGALSELGFRVLMVDGDVVNHSLSSSFGSQPSIPGKEINLATISPYLSLLQLNIHPDKVKEFFVQSKFSLYLDELNNQDQYDYILIDSLPINSHSETAAMLDAVHKTLLILWPLRSLKNSLSQSLEILTKNKAEILGLIFNGFPESADNYKNFSPSNQRQER